MYDQIEYGIACKMQRAIGSRGVASLVLEVVRKKWEAAHGVIDMRDYPVVSQPVKVHNDLYRRDPIAYLDQLPPYVTEFLHEICKKYENKEKDSGIDSGIWDHYRISKLKQHV